MSQEEKKSKKGIRFSTVRGFVAFAVVAFAIVGLVFHVGTGTLSAFGISQISAICPLGALETMLGAKEVMLHPFIMLAAVVVIVVLTGKAFCAWVCPTPWIQRFFHPSKGKKQVDEPLTKEEQEQISAAVKGSCSGEAGEGCKTCGLAAVGGKRDGLQIDSRHGVLVGALASAAIFGFPVFCLVCPIGLTFALIVVLWNTFTANDPTWALLVIPVILLLELVFFRKWCGKICPMGALVSLVSNANFTLKPRVSKQACLREQGVDCHACVEACPEQVDPHSKHIPECTKCGACVEACPAHAIKIR